MSPVTPGAPENLPTFWPLREFSLTARVAPYRWHLQQMGEGEDVLLLHGLAGSSHSWRDLIPELAKRYRVTALDLPGHGLTRSYTRSRLSLELIRADLSALLSALDIRPKMIVGHSAGAAIGLDLAANLEGDPAVGVVVINGALESFQGPMAFALPAMARALALNPLIGPFVSQSVSRGDAVAQLLGTMGSSLDERGVACYRHLVADRRHVEGAIGMMASWSLSGLERQLAQIPTATLLIHAANDTAVSVDVARRAADRMPTARLEIIPQGGHLVHEEKPETVLGLIDTFASGLRQIEA